MSKTPNSEPPLTAPDDIDDMPEDTLHVSSLRPTPTAFSTRRLLNWASLALAAVLLLALVAHWLPSVLPAKLTAQPTSFSFAQLPPAPTNTPPTRGAGWKPTGPDWAQGITFTADGEQGYTCGTPGPGAAAINVAVYDVADSAWNLMGSVFSGTRCLISVSPNDANDVVLVDYNCTVCANIAPTSQVFRSHDGGVFWSPLPLPASTFVAGVAWTTTTLFLRIVNSIAPNATTPERFHLFASRADGPFNEISAVQLIGHSAQFQGMKVISSGTMIYAELYDTSCTTLCATFVRSSDEGYHWTQFPATYQGDEIVQLTAQPNSNLLAGWAFSQNASQLTMMRSFDNGAHWQLLPDPPDNALNGNATIFALPDNSIYVWSQISSSLSPSFVYALADGSAHWQAVAPPPVGAVLAVQYDATGHAIAIWGEAHVEDESGNAPGLEYYPLVGNAG